MGQIAGRRHGVQVPTDEHALGPAKVRAGHDRVAVPFNGQMRDGDERLLDEIGQVPLLVRLARDVDEGRRERDDIGREIQFRHVDNVVPVTATPTPVTGPASAIGLATFLDDQVLDVWYPEPTLSTNPVDVRGLDSGIDSDEIRGVHVRVVSTSIAELSAAPVDTADAYLRLHLLSHRLVQPRTINLDGIFGLLPIVAWTNRGAVAADRIADARLRGRSKGQHLTVYGVDRFPRMVDYVVPSGVRIADADRVRLGAHLASGTVVMHEGFCNFNAGTLGTSMVEGRISAGVIVGDGSDIGGGASIMGTLSGGGTEVITVGAGCLIGANAGVGLSLGDNCVVEAGLYVTAGSKVTLPDGTVAKAKEVSGRDNLLFRRNSQTGAIEVVSRTGSWGGLNAALHATD